MAKQYIKIIECPVCGSKKVKKDGDNHYACLSCQAAFFIDAPQPTVNHRHFTSTPSPQPMDKKKFLYFIVGVAFILFMTTLFPMIFRSCSDSPKPNAGNKIGAAKQDEDNLYAFDDYETLPFVDVAGNIKLLIVGQIDKVRGRDEQIHEHFFWSVYDVKTEKMGQINMLEINGEPIKNWTNRIGLNKLDDGNIYINYYRMHLFKFDIHTQTVKYLNNEIMESSQELKTGIAHIEIESSRVNFYKVKSNSSKTIFYAPATQYAGKVNSLDSFYLSAPNPDPQDYLSYVSTSSDPSYLVKLKTRYTIGYPIEFEPYLRVIKKEDESFQDLKIHDYEKLRSRLVSYEVLNTQNFQYKMEVIDFRDDLVAIGVKNTNTHDVNYILQLLDGEGNLKWATNSTSKSLNYREGALSPTEGVLVPKCCGEYEYFDIQGNSLKNFDVDDIQFLYK